MDVVLALAVSKTGIHLRDVEVAVGDGRMTGAAAVPGIVAVQLVAGQATQSLVHPPRRPVVGGSRLVTGIRRMALDADPHDWVVRHLHFSLSLPQGQSRQLGDGEIPFLAPVIKSCDKSGICLLVEDRSGLGVIRPLVRLPILVYLVTGHAGNCRHGTPLLLLQFPGTLGAERFHHLLHGPLEEHAVATETVEVDLLGGIVFGIQKNMAVIHRMTARAPVGIFGGMATFTIVHYLQQLRFFQPYLLLVGLFKVAYQHLPLLLQAVDAVAQGSTMALLAGDVAVE